MFDEFGEGIVEHVQKEGETGVEAPWVNWGSTVTGTITPCFKGGFLFRIHDSEKREWALYNDTFVYEMHASFTFGPDADIEPFDKEMAEGDKTPEENPNNIRAMRENKELTISLVVYPMETVYFARGGNAKYRCHFDGKALSQEYIQRQADAMDAEIRKEEKATEEVVKGAADIEAAVRVCRLRRTPFFDTSFPPNQSSLDKGRGLIQSTGWRRPEAYLPPALRDQLRLFRGPVTPTATQRGELGNSWVLSAMAALAEHPEQVKNLFRHPLDPAETLREEAMGTYRVWLNKDGLWQSIILDSFLPVLGRQQRYARSTKDTCEMWVSYLEKAYAKRYGCYSSIAGGDPLFAMRDFTGFPTSRLDAAFRECTTDAAKRGDLYNRIAQDLEKKHTVLMSAPGSGDPLSSHQAYKDRRLLVGYAYVVLDTRVFAPSMQQKKLSDPVRLLRMRNPWTSGMKWAGRWGSASPLWKDHPEAASAYAHCGTETGTFIVDWDEVLELFVGCGIVFNHFDQVDYRIPFAFEGGVPDVCLEVHVTERTELTMVLSQPETKGTPREGEEYAPVMVTVAGVNPAAAAVAAAAAAAEGASNSGDTGAADASPPPRGYAVVANSSSDAEAPSKSFTFLQGRDVSLMYTFTPEHSPYLVIPRLLDRPPQTGSAPATENEGKDVPKKHRNGVLGVLSKQPFTSDGHVQVKLRRIPATNRVYENFLTFDNDSTEVSRVFFVGGGGTGLVQQKGAELS